MQVTFAGCPAPGAEPAAPVDAVELVGDLPAGDQVVAVSSAGVVGGVHAVRVARALTMRTDIALVEVTGSPTQLAALHLAASHWPQQVPAVAVHELATYLRSASRTVAVITSVTKLSEPAPSVVQHALSALPWTKFTVDYDFDRVVLGGQPPRRSHGLLGPVVAAASDQAAEPLLGPLCDWAGSHVVRVAAPAGSGQAARRWAEVTVLPDDPERLLARWAAGLDVRTCAGCSRAATGRTCLFCGYTAADARTPAAPTSSARVAEPLSVEPLSVEPLSILEDVQ